MTATNMCSNFVGFRYSPTGFLLTAFLLLSLFGESELIEDIAIDDFQEHNYEYMQSLENQAWLCQVSWR